MTTHRVGRTVVYGPVAVLSIIIALTVAVYLDADIGGAYLAADDFQWLTGGKVFTWARIWETASGDHFYRPVIDIWFAGLVRVCGQSTSCFHAANLTIHLVNISLLFWLARLLGGGVRVPFLAGLLFALTQGHTQAIVWVSGITALLATLFFLTSLTIQVRSWRLEGQAVRRAHDALAVLFAVLAMFSHETGSLVPIVSGIMWWEFNPAHFRRRPILIGGFALALIAFGVATVIANQRHYLFTQSQYVLGWHAVRNFFEYLVDLYVGPGWWLAYLFCLAGLLVLLLSGPIARFGALWLVITLIPYIWFLNGSISRYLYLPSAGFALAMGAGLTSLVSLLGDNSARRRRLVEVAYVLVVLFIVVRFSRFYVNSVRSQVNWTKTWRPYAEHIIKTTRWEGNALRVPVSLDSGGGDIYIEPIIRWTRQEYHAPVHIER